MNPNLPSLPPDYQWIPIHPTEVEVGDQIYQTLDGKLYKSVYIHPPIDP